MSNQVVRILDPDPAIRCVTDKIQISNTVADPHCPTPHPPARGGRVEYLYFQGENLIVGRGGEYHYSRPEEGGDDEFVLFLECTTFGPE